MIGLIIQLSAALNIGHVLDASGADFSPLHGGNAP